VAIQHKKNTAYYLAFPMVDKVTTAAFKSGETINDTAYYKDAAGAWTVLAITDTVSEISTTGMYEIDLTAAEMNHDQIIIKMTGANSVDAAFVFDTRTELAEDLGNGTGKVSLLTATQASVDAIEADTNELQTDDVPALIAALNNISSSSVLTQVNAALDTAIAELAVGSPTTTPSIRTGIMLMYMRLREKLVVQTSATDAVEIYNSTGTKIASKLISDDGSDYTEERMT